MLRETELDENRICEDISELEASRERLRQIEAAEKEVAQAGPLSAGRGHKGADREISRQTGITRQEIQRSRQHVEGLASPFP